MDKGVKRIRANQGHKMKEACSFVHIAPHCCLKSAERILFEHPWVKGFVHDSGWYGHASTLKWTGCGQWAADTHHICPGASCVQLGDMSAVIFRFFGIYLPLQFHTGFWYCCDSAIYQPEASFICSFDWPKDFEILLKQWPNLDLSILCHCFHRHSWYLYEALASQKEDLRRCLASYQARRFETDGPQPYPLCAARGKGMMENGSRGLAAVIARSVLALWSAACVKAFGATVAWSISWPFVACLRYSQPENRMPFCWSTKECFLSFEIYREYYIMNITCTMIMYDVVIQSFTAFRFSWLCS